MGSAAVSEATWIEIVDSLPDEVLARTLDRGEAAAIPLAERLSATLLCDDAAARAHRGLLDRIRPVVESMRAAGMFVSEALLREVLASAAESDDEPGA